MSFFLTMTFSDDRKSCGLRERKTFSTEVTSAGGLVNKVRCGDFKTSVHYHSVMSVGQVTS